MELCLEVRCMVWGVERGGPSFQTSGYPSSSSRRWFPRCYRSWAKTGRGQISFSYLIRQITILCLLIVATSHVTSVAIIVAFFWVKWVSFSEALSTVCPLSASPQFPQREPISWPLAVRAPHPAGKHLGWGYGCSTPTIFQSSISSKDLYIHCKTSSENAFCYASASFSVSWSLSHSFWLLRLDKEKYRQGHQKSVIRKA